VALAAGRDLATCMASSRAACVLGGVRLTSSASSTLVKTGPGRKRNVRLPVRRSSWMTSVPVMSDGIRSGVNWMRWNWRPRQRARLLIMSVLAKPGTPSSITWPRAKRAIRSWSTTASWPTMTLVSSARMRA
jgi:hypothetical protein